MWYWGGREGALEIWIFTGGRDGYFTSIRVGYGEGEGVYGFGSNGSGRDGYFTSMRGKVGAGIVLEGGGGGQGSKGSEGLMWWGVGAIALYENQARKS